MTTSRPTTNAAGSRALGAFHADSMRALEDADRGVGMPGSSTTLQYAPLERRASSFSTEKHPVGSLRHRQVTHVCVCIGGSEPDHERCALPDIACIAAAI